MSIERKINRRDFLKLAGAAGVVGALSAACRGAEAVLQTSTPEEPTLQPTKEPTAKPLSTEVPPTPTTKPSVTPSLVPTEVPTEMPTKIPEPTKVPPTPTEEPPTPTPEIKIFGGTVITKEMVEAYSGVGAEGTMEMVDECIRDCPVLRFPCLMGIEANLGGQKGIVEVLKPVGGEKRELLFVFRDQPKENFPLKDLVSGEEVMVGKVDWLTVIGKTTGETALVMYMEIGEEGVRYHLGEAPFDKTQEVLGNFEDETQYARWQANTIEEDLWTSIQEAIKPTPTPEPTPEATPTPEYKFEFYDVYVGDIEGEGKVLIAIFQDGKLLFQSLKSEPRCDNRNYIPFAFTKVGNFQPDSFNLRVGFQAEKIVSGKLISADIVTGSISSGQGYEMKTAYGPVTCPGAEFSFKAKKVGNGKPVLLKAWRDIWLTPPWQGFQSATDKQVQDSIEKSCGCVLP